MKIRISVSLAVTALIVACAPAKFDREEVADCTAANGCTGGGTEPYSTYSKKVTISGASVDILFVNDNSGSMSFEQKSMAQRFSNFLAALDNKLIDYRIAMVTTDVTAGVNLISFGNNRYYLTPSMGDRETAFANAIQRQETLKCEAFLQANKNADKSTTAYKNGLAANCPSGDERGIYAANAVVKNNPLSFIRTNAHLAVVVLADEDVRSNLYSKTSTYALSSDDLPQTLIANVQSRYGAKSLSVHSIIVNPGSLKSGTPQEVAAAISSTASGGRNYPAEPYFTGANQSCANEQLNQIDGVSGSYGHLYALASMMTNGRIGNICASDYGAQLYDIGDNIGKRVRDFSLVCSNPENIKVTPNVPYTVESSIITIDDSVATGTQITIDWKCRNY